MYLDYVVDIPDVKGKITFRTKSKARYVLMVSRLIDFFSQGYHGLCYYTRRIIVSLSSDHRRKTTVGGTNPPMVSIADKVSPD